MSDLNTPVDPMTDVKAQLQRIDRMFAAQAMSDAVATGMSGVTFVSQDAKEQATQLIRANLKVEGDQIKTPTGQAPASV